jgi:hypothetical protein
MQESPAEYGSSRIDFLCETVTGIGIALTTQKRLCGVREFSTVSCEFKLSDAFSKNRVATNKNIEG